MSDLISREVVKTAIKDYMKSLIDKHIFDVDVVDCAKGISEVVDSVPIAFDVDKVIEKLADKIEPNEDFETGEPCNNWVVDMQNELISDCINIVKGAVKDE